MAKALWLGVAIVVFEVSVTLCAPVVRKLQNAALAERPGRALTRGIGDRLILKCAVQKVKRELHFREIEFAQHAHAHHAGVKIQCDGGVFHAQHAVVQHKALRCGLDFGARACVVFSGEAHVALCCLMSV